MEAAKGGASSFTIAVSELPHLIYSKETAKIQFVASWKKKSGKTKLTKKENLPLRKTSRSLSPLHVGSFEAYDLPSPEECNLKKGTFAFKESYWCQSNNHGPNCNCNFTYTVFYDDLTKAHVTLNGSHSNAWGGQKCETIPFLIEREICRRAELGETAAKIYASINEDMATNNSHHKYPGWEVVTVTKISNLLKNFRRSSPKISDQELLRNLFSKLPDSIVSYPKPDSAELEALLKIDANTDTPWWVGFSHKALLEKGLGVHGDKIIGLDGVYKITTSGCPIWVVVFKHRQNENGIIGAMFVGSHDNEETLKKCMKFLKEEVQRYVPDWNPSVMIDMDKKERGGLEQNGFTIILCVFHIIRALAPRINGATTSSSERAKLWGLVKSIQRCKTDEQLQEAVKVFKKKAPKISKTFADYFISYWIDDPIWLNGFCDMYRENNEGLWYTNNYDESKIRNVENVYVTSNTKISIPELLKIIVFRILPTEVDILKKSDSGMMKLHQSRRNTLSRIKVRIEAGKRIAENVTEADDGTFSIPSSSAKKQKSYAIKPCTDGAYECDCPFFYWYGKCCKHIFAVLHKIDVLKNVPFQVNSILM
jgi:hypothetical protein